MTSVAERIRGRGDPGSPTAELLTLVAELQPRSSVRARVLMRMDPQHPQLESIAPTVGENPVHPQVISNIQEVSIQQRQEYWKDVPHDKQEHQWIEQTSSYITQLFSWIQERNDTEQHAFYNDWTVGRSAMALVGITMEDAPVGGQQSRITQGVTSFLHTFGGVDGLQKFYQRIVSLPDKQMQLQITDFLYRYGLLGVFGQPDVVDAVELCLEPAPQPAEVPENIDHRSLDPHERHLLTTVVGVALPEAPQQEQSKEPVSGTSLIDEDVVKKSIGGLVGKTEKQASPATRTSLPPPDVLRQMPVLRRHTEQPTASILNRANTRHILSQAFEDGDRGGEKASLDILEKFIQNREHVRNTSTVQRTMDEQVKRLVLQDLALFLSDDEIEDVISGKTNVATEILQREYDRLIRNPLPKIDVVHLIGHIPQKLNDAHTKIGDTLLQEEIEPTYIFYLLLVLDAIYDLHMLASKKQEEPQTI